MGACLRVRCGRRSPNVVRGSPNATARVWRPRVGRPLLVLVVGTWVLSAGLHAAEQVVSPGESIGAKVQNLRPGDALLVRKGVYNESITISGLKGIQAAPIVIKGEPGAEIALARGQDGILFYGGGGSAWVIVDGLKITGARRAGILISGSHHITIRNCISGNNGRWGIQSTLSDYLTVENCELFGSRREHGVYFSTTEHPVARNNKIHDNAGCGIHMNGDRREGGDGIITGGLLEKNVIYNCGLRRGGAAINMDGVEKTLVRNNLIYNNGAGGITVFHGDGLRSGTGNEFCNNTLYFQPGKGRFGLQLFHGAKDTTVRNNIFIGGRGPALEIDQASLAGLKSDCNIFFQQGGGQPVELGGQRMTLDVWKQKTSQDAHSTSAEPKFVNLAGGDFHLAGGSPGIDKGAAVKDVTDDLTGKKRPSGGPCDIGAYEK